MAWSGDIFQQNVSEGTNLKFVIPEEGGTIWTDNMCIPKTAQNPVDALTLMDFFYQPEIAATLAEYINYVTPGAGRPGADQAPTPPRPPATTRSRWSRSPSSPLVFPVRGRLRQAALLPRLRDGRREQQRVPDAIFEPIAPGLSR